MSSRLWSLYFRGRSHRYLFDRRLYGSQRRSQIKLGKNRFSVRPPGLTIQCSNLITERDGTLRCHFHYLNAALSLSVHLSCCSFRTHWLLHNGPCSNKQRSTEATVTNSSYRRIFQLCAIYLTDCLALGNGRMITEWWAAKNTEVAVA
jgi:hypothetical protein